MSALPLIATAKADIFCDAKFEKVVLSGFSEAVTALEPVPTLPLLEP